MLRRLLPLSLLCTVSMAGVAHSTTVIPPTFEYLVANAATIFVGEVMDVRARWIATAQGRGVMTDVIFKVEEVWKGRLGGVTQLEFLGGTIDGITMEVVGMPTFHEGQRSVLFVSDQVRTISPLVSFWHGRMRVEKDPFGVDRVRTYDGRSLGSPAEVAGPRANPMISVAPMRLTDLGAAVRGRVLAGRAR